MATISVVVPCFNEEDHILDLLSDLNSQLLKPNEVLIIDAGSTDKTIENIDKEKSNLSFLVKVINGDGSLPGKARNIGVSKASFEYIGFMDCGLKIPTNWIENQLYKISHSDTEYSFGTCRFFGISLIQKLICSYTNGLNSITPLTVPGLVISKKIFLESQPFRDDLRAGEDTVWRNHFFYKNNERISADVNLEYTSYPDGFMQACKKWYMYAKAVSGLSFNLKQERLYYLFFITLISGFFFCFKVSFNLLIFYFIFRGYIDPVRRSSITLFKEINIVIYLIFGPMFIFALDFSKCLGFLIGKFKRS